MISGIKLVGELLKSGKILINENCKDIIREFSLYRWDESRQNDAVVKEYDHALDEMRYFCSTILQYKPNYVNKTSAKVKPKNYSYNLLSDWGDDLRLV